MTRNQELKYLQMAVNLYNAHITNPQMPAEHGLREIEGYLERVIEHKKEANQTLLAFQFEAEDGKFNREFYEAIQSPPYRNGVGSNDADAAGTRGFFRVERHKRNAEVAAEARQEGKDTFQRHTGELVKCEPNTRDTRPRDAKGVGS